VQRMKKDGGAQKDIGRDMTIKCGIWWDLMGYDGAVV
jgi:hypothetical protein